MKLIAVTASLCAVAGAADPHAGHDHSLLKPQGPFYSIYTHENKNKDKVWNDMELSIVFKENTFDMKWWYGAKIPMVNIPKQTFTCTDVPFTFDESKLRVVIVPSENACLNNINSKFPRGFGLSSPFYIPVDHDTGDLMFGLAGNTFALILYAIDAEPASIPSGVNGLAPAASLPSRRKETASAPEVAAPVSKTSGDAGSPSNKANDETADALSESNANVIADTDATSTTTKTATAKLGSVLVSTAAIVFAGLFL